MAPIPQHRPDRDVLRLDHTLYKSAVLDPGGVTLSRVSVACRRGIACALHSPCGKYRQCFNATALEHRGLRCGAALQGCELTVGVLQALRCTDERLKLTMEALTGIRVVK